MVMVSPVWSGWQSGERVYNPDGQVSDGEVMTLENRHVHSAPIPSM